MFYISNIGSVHIALLDFTVKTILFLFLEMRPDLMSERLGIDINLL